MKHIPMKESTEIEILTFDEALISNNHSCTYDKDSWIYVPDFYSEYRYILGTVGENPLITIGINPSTASPENLDNTLKSVDRIRKSNGFDSFIMFNVYAQRATNPEAMDCVFNEKLHEENMKAFTWLLSRCHQPSIWAAWGTIVTQKTYLMHCMKDMVEIAKEYNAKWYKAGELSKHGHPHHPLYLKADTQLEAFEIQAYLQKLFEKK